MEVSFEVLEIAKKVPKSVGIGIGIGKGRARDVRYVR